jgi:FAD/FMN-containing dehydrogenase
MVLREHAGAPIRLRDADIRELRASFHGELILPDNPAYDRERRVFNAAIDRYPAVIAQITGPHDAAAAIAFARRHELPLAVRSGGHSTPGFGVVDGGVVIDTQLLKSVEVDPVRQVARAGAGLRAGEYVTKTEQLGLVSPIGDALHTGLAGLTLGGGYGYLSGKYGLAIDNLLAAEVITADGRILRASEESYADLFWALRGGSGNFGVVTSLEFRMHPMAQVYGGMLLFPFPVARDLLRAYRELTAAAPDELTTYAVLATPPGQDSVVGVIVCYAGEAADGERAIAPFRAFGPVVDMVGPRSYSSMGEIVAPFAPEGMQRDDRWLNLPALTDDTIDALIALAEPSRSLGSAIVVKQLNGAAARVSPTATAFPHRMLPYSILALAQWPDPSMAAPMIAWVRDVIDTLRQATGGVYVNGAEDESLDSIYGVNYARLVQVKNRYDPSNVFNSTINIVPSI